MHQHLSHETHTTTFRRPIAAIICFLSEVGDCLSFHILGLRAYKDTSNAANLAQVVLLALAQ